MSSLLLITYKYIYLMLQDKKIKFQLNYNRIKKIKKCEKLVTYI